MMQVSASQGRIDYARTHQLLRVRRGRCRNALSSVLSSANKIHQTSKKAFNSRMALDSVPTKGVCVGSGMRSRILDAQLRGRGGRIVSPIYDSSIAKRKQAQSPGGWSKLMFLSVRHSPYKSALPVGRVGAASFWGQIFVSGFGDRLACSAQNGAIPKSGGVRAVITNITSNDMNEQRRCVAA